MTATTSINDNILNTQEPAEFECGKAFEETLLTGLRNAADARAGFCDITLFGKNGFYRVPCQLNPRVAAFTVIHLARLFTARNAQPLSLHELLAGERLLMIVDENRRHQIYTVENDELRPLTPDEEPLALETIKKAALRDRINAHGIAIAKVTISFLTVTISLAYFALATDAASQMLAVSGMAASLYAIWIGIKAR